ncbi:hypothetical protein AYO41_05495 [Verrucomicrobia bacterium SCGC AG-212-E04]|nr:hypothetical protein AYO41_05495 [Verrucomicrobia bacterium SCGC AG-212-E04]
MATSPLSDETVARLQRGCEQPEFVDGRYVLGPELGRGGMGVVYEVTDTHLDRRVALKVVPAWAAADPPALERLRQEARILAGLEHPGIAPVHEIGSLADGRHYYTMRLVRGTHLSLSDDSTVPDRLRIFVRICETVAFAHTQGVIHRDLKPENILLGPFGEVTVLDWGVARLVNREVSAAAGERAGTRAYMAPEQIRGADAEIDARSDVFALGCLLRFMAGQESGRLARPLQSIISKATAAARSERYESAESLARDVLHFLDGLPVAAHRESLVERTGRLLRRHRLLVALIATYLVVRAALFFFFSR